MADNESGEGSGKKSSKKARSLTSGQLRKEAEKRAPKEKKAAAKASPKDMRDMTAARWAVGRTGDPLVKAFVNDHTRGRVVKKKPGEWMELFKAWLKKPRG